MTFLKGGQHKYMPILTMLPHLKQHPLVENKTGPSNTHTLTDTHPSHRFLPTAQIRCFLKSSNSELEFHLRKL